MKRQWIVAAALVLITIGAVAFYFNRARRSAGINFHPYQALGTIAAEEISRLLAQRGSIVVVLNDPGSEPDPVLEAQLAAFRQTLKQNGSVSIASFERIQMDPMTRMSTGGTLPPDQFRKLIAKTPPPDAFVLFIGFPVLGPNDLSALRETRAKFVVISAALPGYRNLISAGVIQMAIVPKVVSADDQPPEPKSIRDWFDREYQIVTQANADQLPF